MDILIQFKKIIKCQDQVATICCTPLNISENEVNKNISFPWQQGGKQNDKNNILPAVAQKAEDFAKNNVLQYCSTSLRAEVAVTKLLISIKYYQ